MKKIFYAIAIFFCYNSLHSQTVRQLPEKALDLYPTLSEMYGYAIGQYQDYLLVFGGRIRSELSEIQEKDFPNLDLLLIDFKRNRASAFTTSTLEGLLAEQMNATGMAYYQKEKQLFLIGGYGYSETHHQFMTFPYVTVIDLEATINALLEGKNPVANFFQICDDRMAIFDGTMDYNGQEFFLINGKYAYKLEPFAENPEYFENDLKGEGRTFMIDGEGQSLEIKNFQTWYDLEDLREIYGPLLPELIEQEILKVSPGNADF